MTTPTAAAKAIPVPTSTGIARAMLRFFSAQPANAPVPTATGTVSTLQKTPAIGQMIEFIARGAMKDAKKTQPA